jgi:hypothetical protein
VVSSQEYGVLWKVLMEKIGRVHPPLPPLLFLCSLSETWVLVDVESNLNSLDLLVQKQVLELVALIGKYPTRTFAVAGSSAEIAYPALRVFLREHIIKKIGILISTEVLSRLHIINGIVLLK